MSLELIYTSAAKGLKAGSSGFCTVAVTGGMSRLISTKLEMLSGYEFPFKISDPNARLSPINFAHTSISMDSGLQSVLSRICFSGSDYSGRANKIAHHFLLAPRESLSAGPAVMLLQMQQHDLFQTDWQGAAQELPEKHLDRILNPVQDEKSDGAGIWKKITGDQGWAGILAQAFIQNKKVPAYVIFKPGQDVLALFAESLSCLPQDIRWNVCFATYYTVLPAGCYYHWRGILAGSAAQKEIARFPNATVIDLTMPLPAAEDNPYSKAAREGTVVQIQKPDVPKLVPEAALQPINRHDSMTTVDEPAQDRRRADALQRPAGYIKRDELASYLPRPTRRASKKKMYFVLAASALGILLVLAGGFLSYRFFLKDTPPISQKAEDVQSPKDAENAPGQSVAPEQSAPTPEAGGIAKKDSKSKGTQEDQLPNVPPKDPNQSILALPKDPNTIKKESHTDKQPNWVLFDRADIMKRKPCIEKIWPDETSTSTGFEFSFQLKNNIKGFLMFPQINSGKKIESELAGNQLKITCPAEVGFGPSKLLATCVIDNNKLRYRIEDDIKNDERTKSPREQSYLPIARSIVIEMLGENGCVYQCQMRTEIDNSQNTIAISYTTEPNNLSDELIQALPGDLTSQYKLPLFVSKTEDHKLLLEMLIFENAVSDAQKRCKNIHEEIKKINNTVFGIDKKINNLQPQSNPQRPDPKTEKLNQQKTGLTVQCQRLMTESSNIENTIFAQTNLRIDKLKIPEDEKTKLKSDYLPTRLKAIRKGNVYNLDFEDVWGIAVFKATFRID